MSTEPNITGTGHEITYEEALHTFSSCRNALDCLESYQKLSMLDLSVTSKKLCARACVYSMYYTNTFSLAALKTLFVYRGSPLVNNVTTIKALVATWVKNVGRVRKTLHWASEPFYFYLNGMLSMSLQDVQAEFKQGSRMDGLSKGVMEVMFWVSCFQPPVVVALGDCFWDLARELVRLQVSDVDQLNYLFWGGLIPQTVIVLEAREYQMDSMIPPIRADISIEGCVCPVEHTNLSEEHVQEDETRTVLRIPSNSSLIFIGSVRLLNLTVSHLEMSSVHTLSEVSMKFVGLEPDHATIVMDCVKMCSAGCSVSNYSKVNCNHFSVTGAMAGFIGYNIKSLHMTGSQTHLENPSFKTGFFFCDTAMLLRDVTSFIVTKQTFYENNVVFDMRVRAVCIVEDSVIARCDHMGEIMTSVNCHPTFIRVVIDPAVSNLVEGEEQPSQEHETLFVSNPLKCFKCSSFHPEEV